jgi:Fe-S cluster biogenesis protein NfuA
VVVSYIEEGDIPYTRKKVENMVDKQAVMNVFERVKPLFIEHEGDFKVEEITDDGVVKVKLIGECLLCVYKEKTTRAIEAMVKNEVPNIKRVEIV